MGKQARRAAFTLVAVLSLALIPAVAQAAVTGSLTQLASPNNCIQPGSTGMECGTHNGVGIQRAQDLAVSPDGKNVYVLGSGSEAIAEFTRNADGSLTQLSGANNCIAEHGHTACGTNTATGLQSANAIIVSPDGKNVYVAGREGYTGAVAEFTRNADGSLTQLASPNDCIQEHGSSSGCGTKTGHGLVNPYHLAISPDGNNLYVGDGGSAGNGSERGAVSEFSRNPSTGALAQLGSGHDCIEESPGTDECSTTGRGLLAVNQVIVSSDGKNVYTATDNTPGAIAEFTRNATSGALTQLASPNNCIEETQTPSGTECGTETGLGINDIYGLNGSPDGHNVYSASIDSSGALAEFARDSTSGALTQLAGPNNCIEEHGQVSPVGCGNQTGNGIGSGYDLKVSPDGQNVYVVATDPAQGYALSEFARNADGSLSQLASPNDCIQETGGNDCGTTNGRGLSNPQGVAISPDGANVYVATYGGTESAALIQGAAVTGPNRGPSAVAEFARVLPPPAAPASTPTPSTQSKTPAPVKSAVKAKKTKKHHKKKKAHKRVKAKRVMRPTFTG